MNRRDAETQSEQEVRRLRATIYGEVSDQSWLKVRENWMKPENIMWLQSHQPSAVQSSETLGEK